MQRPIKVFISYKWEDEVHNAWVRKLAGDLRSFGIDTLLDQWEVKYGQSFTDYMTSSIRQSDVMLFIMTPKSVAAAEAPSGKGGAVKFEVQLASARRIAGESFRFIGVLRKGKKTASHLRDFRYVDFKDDQKYDEVLRTLIHDLLESNSKPALGNPPALLIPTSAQSKVNDGSETPITERLYPAGRTIKLLMLGLILVLVIAFLALYASNRELRRMAGNANQVNRIGNK